MTDAWKDVDWDEVKRLCTEKELVGEVLALVTAIRANVTAGQREFGFIPEVADVVADPTRAAAALLFLSAIMLPLLDTLDAAGVNSAGWLQRVALAYQ